MSGAVAVGVLGVVNLVVGLAPQLINDVESLSTLFTNASNAVQNAQANGGVVPAEDWAALRGQETELRLVLDKEAEAAGKQADSASGAAQS